MTRKMTHKYHGKDNKRVLSGKIDDKIEKLSLSVEQGPLSILLTNYNGIIEYVNPRFEELTGYKKEEVIGKKPGIVSSGYHSREFYEEMWREIRSGNQWRGVFHNRKKDGSIYYESAIITPILSEQGEITNFMCIKEDITARLTAEQKLKESIFTRDKLFSIISHDLRGPVGNMPPLLDILINNTIEDEESRKELLISMRKAAYNIKDLLENLLKWASLQTGSISLSPVDFNILDTTSWEIDLYSSLASEKNILIVNNISGDLSANADVESFKLIIRNLIGNAFKYSYPGGKVILNAISEGNMVRISVEDQGVGMTNETIAKILESDSFISTYGTGNEKGTGLGLNLCKEFVRKNGGELFIESIPGKGTKISFTLNKVKNAVSEEIQNSIIPEKVTEKLLGNSRILLVDDDEFNKVYTSALFGKWGTDYATASNGDDGIRFLKNSTYDIIIMDLEMPVMDGINAIKFIREEMNNEIPAIAVSANDSAKYIKKVLKGGFNEYIVKPYSEDQLMSAVIRLLRKEKMDENTKNEDSAILKSEKIADTEKLKLLFSGDNNATSEMLQKFLDIVPPYYQDALDAFAAGDIKLLHSHIHKLKSSIAIVASGRAAESINLINSLSEKGTSSALLRKEMEYLMIWFPQLREELKAELEIMKTV